MKNLFISVMLILAFSVMCISQGTLPKPKIYDSWYYLESLKRQPLHVYTYQFGDSTVSYIVREKYIYGVTPKTENIENIPVTEIDRILFRKKGTKAAAVGTCTAVGLLTGVIIGVSTKKHYHDILEEQINAAQTVFPIFICTGLGLGIGFSIGSIKKTVRIGGDIDAYQQIKPTLQKYSIKFYIP